MHREEAEGLYQGLRAKLLCLPSRRHVHRPQEHGDLRLPEHTSQQRRRIFLGRSDMPSRLPLKSERDCRDTAMLKFAESPTPRKGNYAYPSQKERSTPRDVDVTRAIALLVTQVLLRRDASPCSTCRSRLRRRSGSSLLPMPSWQRRARGSQPSSRCRPSSGSSRALPARPAWPQQRIPKPSPPSALTENFRGKLWADPASSEICGLIGAVEFEVWDADEGWLLNR